jgi:hypothetical protein
MQKKINNVDNFLDIKSIAALPNLNVGSSFRWNDTVYFVKNILQTYEKESQSLNFDLILEIIEESIDSELN